MIVIVYRYFRTKQIGIKKPPFIRLAVFVLNLFCNNISFFVKEMIF